MSHLQFPMLLTRPRILWKHAIWLPQQRRDSRLGPCRHHPSVVDSEQKHRRSVRTDRQLSRALRLLLVMGSSYGVTFTVGF